MAAAMADDVRDHIENGMAADLPPSDYRVGNCQPPLETRFKKGQSGNPKGRPKGAKNTRTLLQEKLGEKVKVRTPDGRTRKLSKREIGITKLVNRFAEMGDLKTFELLMKMEGDGAEPDERAGPMAGERAEEEISATGKAMLDWYVRKHARDPEDE
jgi:hypothetical protein